MSRWVIVCLAVFLHGCVGLAVGTYGTFEGEKTSVSISNKRNAFSYGGSSTPLTKEVLLSSWGEPDAVDQVGHCEVVTYHDGYTWSGVGAFFVFFPIPLLIPTGHDENRFYFVDGELVGLVTEYGDVTGALGYMCGSNACRGLAGRVNADKPRKITVKWCE